MILKRFKIEWIRISGYNKTNLNENANYENILNEISISNCNNYSWSNVKLSALYWYSWTFIVDYLLFLENNAISYLNILVED